MKTKTTKRNPFTQNILKAENERKNRFKAKHKKSFWHLTTKLNEKKQTLYLRRNQNMLLLLWSDQSQSFWTFLLKKSEKKIQNRT